MIARTLRWLPIATLTALLAWSVVDARRVAQLAGEHEVAARRWQRELEVERARADGAVATHERLERDVARLQRDLDGALDHVQALGEALTEEVEAREQAAVARLAADAIVSVPPPPGVQRCLQALRDCLRADGFADMRPLRASAVGEFVLRDVEWLDLGGGGAGSVIVAARMTATLHRDRSELVLHFESGWQRQQGVRSELPQEGLAVVLRPVEGRVWEVKLPYLVRGDGEYAATAAVPKAVDEMDPVTRAQWLERFDQLLADAGTDLKLRVGGFTALRGATFRSAQLFGYDRGRLLALAADCAELAVEIDERAGIVSLLLKDGVLLREGVESTIGSDGFRMLLPDVTPKQAADRMTGMVVRR